MNTCIPMVSRGKFLGLAYHAHELQLDMNTWTNISHTPLRAAKPGDDQPLWTPLIGWGMEIRPLMIAVDTTADANAEWNPDYTPRRAA